MDIAWQTACLEVKRFTVGKFVRKHDTRQYNGP